MACPQLRCLGMSGQSIYTIIDTGAQVATISLSASRRHYSNHVQVGSSKQPSCGGIGGVVDRPLRRFTLTLNIQIRRPGGETKLVQGECWIYPNDGMLCDLLLGMPFLKQN